MAKARKVGGGRGARSKWGAADGGAAETPAHAFLVPRYPVHRPPSTVHQFQRSPQDAEERQGGEDVDRQVDGMIAPGIQPAEGVVDGEGEVQQRPAADRLAVARRGERLPDRPEMADRRVLNDRRSRRRRQTRPGSCWHTRPGWPARSRTPPASRPIAGQATTVRRPARSAAPRRGRVRRFSWRSNC